ncbi:MAG: hypothetical protein O3B43_03170, partial [Chloroflexi bacterium]|nr:hypothetical protein [Chloroflexota bacterium]
MDEIMLDLVYVIPLIDINKLIVIHQVEELASEKRDGWHAEMYEKEKGSDFEKAATFFAFEINENITEVKFHDGFFFRGMGDYEVIDELGHHLDHLVDALKDLMRDRGLALESVEKSDYKLDYRNPNRSRLSRAEKLEALKNWESVKRDGVVLDDFLT